MTNELEKQFFDTFGIEPKDRFKGCKNGIDFYSYACEIPSCKGCPKEIRGKEYPQITDHILLELIRIIGLITIKYTNEQCEICYGDGAISYLGKDLKEAILNFLISKVSIFKQQVRTLFEEV